MTLLLNTQCKSTQNVDSKSEPKKELSSTQEMDMYKTAWVWRHTKSGEKMVEPKEKDKFSIRFEKERLDITTDCNGMSANYKIEDNKITLTEFVSTRMYCVQSQESVFSNMLQLAERYEVSEKGHTLKLILNDKSVMLFENLNK